ncbi:MAG TPA: hypothetical protein VFG89_08480 [Coriobacteriia bacterium]|nr:hypothetical protein [Coriobacteriia bacterium]
MRGVDELGGILRRMYDGAPQGEKVVKGMNLAKYVTPLPRFAD